jgi:hypothetical protein
MAFDPAKLRQALKSPAEPAPFPPPFDPPANPPATPAEPAFGLAPGTEEGDPPTPFESAPEGYPTLEEEQDEDPYEGVDVTATSEDENGEILAAKVGGDWVMSPDYDFGPTAAAYVAPLPQPRADEILAQNLDLIEPFFASDVVRVGDVFERTEKRGRGQRVEITWLDKDGDVAAYHTAAGREVLIPAWKLLSYRFKRVASPL